jgi:hypothetical protein
VIEHKGYKTNFSEFWNWVIPKRATIGDLALMMGPDLVTASGFMQATKFWMNYEPVLAFSTLVATGMIGVSGGMYMRLHINNK